PEGESQAEVLYAPDADADPIVMGLLHVLAYAQESRTVYVIPVSQEQPDGVQLQAQLNAIYGPAIVDWDVVVEPIWNNIAWDKDERGVNLEESGLLTAYPPELKNLIRRYTWERTFNPNHYYLFLVNLAEGEGSIAGYMPRKRNKGFVFTNVTGQNTDAFHLSAAHELGHGAFRFDHWWTETGLPQGTTPNLMDYGGGSALAKRQWEYIRNPQTVNTLAEEDTSAMAVFRKNTREYVIELIRAHQCAKALDQPNFSFHYLERIGWGIIPKWSDVYDESLLENISIRSVEVHDADYGTYFVSTRTPSVSSVRVSGADANVMETMDVNSETRKTILLTGAGIKIHIVLGEDQEPGPLLQLFQAPLPSGYISQTVQAITSKVQASAFTDAKSILASAPACVFEDLSTTTRIALINELIDGTMQHAEQIMVVKLIESVQEPQAFIDDFHVSVAPQEFVDAHTSFLTGDADIMKPLLDALISLSNSVNQPEDVAFVFNEDPKYYIKARTTSVAKQVFFEVKRNYFDGEAIEQAWFPVGWDLVPAGFRAFDLISYTHKGGDDDFRLADNVSLDGIPTITAMMIIGKDQMDRDRFTAGVALDVALLLTGIGEISAAYRAYQAGKTALTLFRLTVAVGDNLTALLDIACKGSDAELCEEWQEISFYVGIGMLSVSAADQIGDLLRRTEKVMAQGAKSRMLEKLA
ncbi:MAG TPA: hypothetical protein DCR93_24925, partial [Cytophagales bacterium]|nr:hypothetical protein [Cytophagales bacterium]